MGNIEEGGILHLDFVLVIDLPHDELSAHFAERNLVPADQFKYIESMWDLYEVGELAGLKCCDRRLDRGRDVGSVDVDLT